MYYVYLVECEDKSIYTGITTDLKRRFSEHKNKKGGNYTSAHQVKKILYTEKHPSRSSASKREAEIKSWKKEKKLGLIKTKNEKRRLGINPNRRRNDASSTPKACHQE